MKRPILLILVCFLIFSVFTACDDKENDSSISSNKNTTASSRPNTTTYVSSETKTLDPEKDYLIYATDPCPLIKNILHRGMGAVAPECTEMAYRYAAKAGYKYVENDLWFTSDGYPVMVHMKDLSAVSNGEGFVTDKTLEYLKTLDFGNEKKFGNLYKGTKILTFEEWIRLCKELDLNPYIDCKMLADTSYEGVHGVQTCLNILKKYGMTERTTWIVGMSGAKSVRSFSNDARIAIIADKQVYPETFEYMKTIVDPNNPDKLVFNMCYTYLTEEIVKMVKAEGINVEAWLSDEETYKYPARAATLYKMGVTGFTNDGTNVGKALNEAGFTW